MMAGVFDRSRYADSESIKHSFAASSGTWRRHTPGATYHPPSASCAGCWLATCDEYVGPKSSPGCQTAALCRTFHTLPCRTPKDVTPLSTIHWHREVAAPRFFRLTAGQNKRPAMLQGSRPKAVLFNGTHLTTGWLLRKKTSAQSWTGLKLRSRSRWKKPN